MAGGAEALCRRTAHALADAGDDVVVYTTTARDYLTWEPHYPAGVSRDGPVEVRRYPVDPPDPARAAALVRALSLAPGDPAAEEAWIRAQGPVSPGLLADVRAAPSRHEVLAFWTYLYATAQLGLPLVADRSVLVPLAHDEPMLRFTVSRGLVRAAAGLAFLTPEEAVLVDDLHGIGDRPWAVVGTGVDPAPPAPPPPDAGSYVLFLGRVDPAKGVLELVDAHARYRRRGGRLGLVLAGRPTVPLRLPGWVRTTGFVDDARRASLLAGAAAVALPSRYESLSLTALEAWQAGRPTIATSACDVVAGQTRRSGGGTVYDDPDGYGAALAALERDPDGAARAARGARAWVAAQTWPAAVRRWRVLLRAVARPVAPATRAREAA
ncbi:MAG: glycosyltransferase [Thermoleophilia bacterium]|nr:glycosyltransferase [Thermoleophilia bacterium]